MRTGSDWLLNAVASRTNLAPEGLGGGEPGVAGRFLVNGKPVSEARKMVMTPAD
jgi:N-methylhydantoinase B